VSPDPETQPAIPSERVGFASKTALASKSGRVPQKPLDLASRLPAAGLPKKAIGFLYCHDRQATPHKSRVGARSQHDVAYHCHVLGPGAYSDSAGERKREKRTPLVTLVPIRQCQIITAWIW
jgi:hypothetical protein